MSAVAGSFARTSATRSAVCPVMPCARQGVCIRHHRQGPAGRGSQTRVTHRGGHYQVGICIDPRSGPIGAPHHRRLPRHIHPQTRRTIVRSLRTSPTGRTTGAARQRTPPPPTSLVLCSCPHPLCPYVKQDRCRAGLPEGISARMHIASSVQPTQFPLGVHLHAPQPPSSVRKSLMPVSPSRSMSVARRGRRPTHRVVRGSPGSPRRSPG